MKVKKKVEILLTEEENDFLENLKHIVNTAVCDQYNNCIDCPFGFNIKGLDTNGCTSQKFFDGLNSITDYDE